MGKIWHQLFCTCFWCVEKSRVFFCMITGAQVPFLYEPLAYNFFINIIPISGLFHKVYYQSQYVLHSF